MAVIHIKNIHNHKIKVGFRNEPLPPYFDGYVDTLTGNIVDPVSNVDTFLQSVKDEVDNTVNKLAGFEDALSCTVTVAQVDSRLEEVECRITNLVTCANSKKGIESFSGPDFTKMLDPSTLSSCALSNSECYYVTECLPVYECLKGLEPGIYLGQLSKTFTSCIGHSVCAHENNDSHGLYGGCIYINLISCLVIPSTCSYGCVSGYQTSAPAFIFQVSEDDIKKAYICNIVGFEKCCFYISGYAPSKPTYGIRGNGLYNCFCCNRTYTYCVCDYTSSSCMSLRDYLSREIPKLYEKANKNIITTSATRLQ